MGGINHAPCGRCLENSTKVSRWMSLAHSELELGNVALENALLIELEQTGCGNEQIVIGLGHISKSAEHLVQMDASIVVLRKQMDFEKYVDLPSLKQVNLEKLGQQLVNIGMVQESSWAEVSALMIRKGGFYAVLDKIAQETASLRNLTVALKTKFKLLEAYAECGQLNLVLEQNWEGNIKAEFARVYHGWGRLTQLFLASSMLSTELWYRHSDYGSLCDGASSKSAAVGSVVRA